MFALRRGSYKWQKPSGVLELDYNNGLTQLIDVFLPFDGAYIDPREEVLGGFRALGPSVIDVGNFISGGDAAGYFSWDESGLVNTYFDGNINTGELLFADMPSLWNVDDGFTTVFQMQSRPHNYSWLASGFGDIAGENLGAAYNGVEVRVSDIRVTIGNRVVIFANALLRDDRVHTYATHVNAQRVHSLYRDGLLVEQIVGDSFNSQRESVVAVSAYSTHHNRGLGGVFNGFTLLNGDYGVDVAQALSANFYQILKPRVIYFDMGAAAPSPSIQAKIRIGESWVNAVPKVRSGGQWVTTDLKI